MQKKDDRKRKGEASGQPAPTVGQLTSGIANKQVRAEQYAKLKHKAKVREAVPSAAGQRLPAARRSMRVHSSSIILFPVCTEGEGRRAA